MSGFLVLSAAALLVAGLVAVAGRARLARGVASPEQRRSARRFGIPVALGNVLTLASYRLDLVVLAAFLPAADVGRYAVASALMEALWVAPDAAAQVLLPAVARDPGVERTARLARVTTLLTLLGGAALIVAGERLVVALFGSDYGGAERALAPLVVAAASLGLWKLLVADLAARGDGRIRAQSSGAGIVAMLAVDLVLVPPHGILGGAIGSAVGYSVAALLAGRAWARAVDVSPGAAARMLLVPRR